VGRTGRKSYSERVEQHVELAGSQADVRLFVRQADEVECCLLLGHWAGDEVLHLRLALCSGFASFILLHYTSAIGHVSHCCDDTTRQVHVPLDLADEVKDDSLFGQPEHLRVEVLGVIRAKHIVTFAISVVVRIVDDFDEAIVAHTTGKRRLNDLGVLALPNLAGDPGSRFGVDHLLITIQYVEIILIKLPTAKIVLNMTRASPCVSLRCFKTDVWRISEGRIETVQMPVRVTKVALQHLALVATRSTTLRAQYRLLVTVENARVVGLLVAVATVLCPVSRQCRFTRQNASDLQRKLFDLFKIRAIGSRSDAFIAGLNFLG
jgi:hypothetical protein